MNFVPRSGVAEALLPLTPDLVGQAGSPELTLAALLQSGYKSWRRRRLSDPPGDLAQRGLHVTGPGGVKGRGRSDLGAYLFHVSVRAHGRARGCV